MFLQFGLDMTCAYENTRHQPQKSRIGSFIHGTNPCLVTRVDQSIGQYDILPSPSSKHHNLCNVLWSQRLTSTVYRTTSASAPIWGYRGSVRINCIRFGFIASKPHKREFLLRIMISVMGTRKKTHGKSYSFDLTWINLDYSDPRGDQFLPETFSETTNSRLACAVYAPARIGLSTSDRSNVNHVAVPAASMKYWEDLLGHLIRELIYWLFLDTEDG